MAVADYRREFLRVLVLAGTMALLVLLVAGQAQPTHAAAITVNGTADVIADDGVCTLREAITAANTDTASGATTGECAAGSGADTITVPAGTYTLSIAGINEDANATGDLDITTDLTINGAGQANTIIDGAALDRVIDVTGNLEMSDLTIQNGLIFAPAPSPGFASSGGGIRNRNTLTLKGSTVSGNTATNNGGGIANYESGFGPGIVILDDSTVRDNTATLRAGGIFNHIGGSVTLTASTVSGNTAGSQGGGLNNFNFRTVLSLTNSTVSDNTGLVGGGIANSGSSSSVTLTASTVSGNTATDTMNQNGGGLFNTGGATLTLKNTIVANSPSGGDCAGPITSITSLGYNLDSDGTCNLTGTGDLSSTPPLLGPLANNGGPTETHALLAGSPAIDAGSGDCPPPATDQRGFVRPQGAACDIGAYEFGALAPSVGGIVEIVSAPSDSPEAQQPGGSLTLELAALAVALAVVSVAGVSWHRYRQRAG